MNRLLRLSLFLLLPACHPAYDHLEIDLVSAPPVPVRVESDEIELPVGVAIVVDVEPKSANDYEYFKDDEVELDPQDRQVLRVDPTADPRRFVITGVKVGQTCIDIEVLGEREQCVPATVQASP
mgnify:CR=1 FL=1